MPEKRLKELCFSAMIRIVALQVRLAAETNKHEQTML
jgi:hypothetical protein